MQGRPLQFTFCTPVAPDELDDALDDELDDALDDELDEALDEALDDELDDALEVCPLPPVLPLLLLEVSRPVCPPAPSGGVVCKSKHPPPMPSMMGADKPSRSQLRASIVFGV